MKVIHSSGEKSSSRRKDLPFSPARTVGSGAGRQAVGLAEVLVTGDPFSGGLQRVGGTGG
jgi:hypothetical protein